eukprot:CAMPEP_0194422630 /NCGR_PEP_ID=MMETSP0176-20130528/21927_1 /TAXON_ID=216777 /ORGANISM="Proboscia alata, Strain PI-D3" /LENGTH=212 /DNA_ID=CAMNT_0039231459 /DNA_START=36 /DNA_END=671 /DNA_ORIENTATION=+
MSTILVRSPLWRNSLRRNCAGSKQSVLNVWFSSSPSTSSSASTSTSTSTSLKKTLALTVHFKQPDFGMKNYEILSRSTAFLLNVDPPYAPSNTDPSNPSTAAYDHLSDAQTLKDARARKRNYTCDPAGGPPNRTPSELGWLEFCPTKFRPRVHCVTSSHVVSPWMWSGYYPQDWIQNVTQEHCVYSLEVLNNNTKTGVVWEQEGENSNSGGG